MAVEPQARISVRRVLNPDTRLGRFLNAISPAIDRVSGISRLHALYEKHRLAGLDGETFARRTLECLDCHIVEHGSLAEALPAKGPVLVVANHPHGAVEGLVLTQLIAKKRGDLKIMANQGLRVFPELAEFFVFVNPLAQNDPRNVPGLRESLRHLRGGGVLVVFPASRTSFYHADKKRISDGEWNRVVGSLARHTQAPVLPVHFTGTNSPLFYRMGRVWYRFRLLMLVRELLRKQGAEIPLVSGSPFETRHLGHLDDAQLTEFMRLQTYTLAAPRSRLKDQSEAAALPSTPLKALAAAGERDLLEAELAALPARQRLAERADYRVFYATGAEIPAMLHEITRERERCFRDLDEGSGEALDTDAFDRDSVQLFCWDARKRALVGAYRMGRVDEMQKAGRESYLEQMFRFGPAFLDGRCNALELGRSFIAPEYQRSRNALDLLWRGIGAWLQRHPQYQVLYGTVSLSRQYSPASIEMMCDGLIDPDPSVDAITSLSRSLPVDWLEYRQRNRVDLRAIAALVAAREPNHKSLPVLLRHYASMGARFHAVAIDSNFAGTPGLLLSVRLDAVPAAKRARYLES